MGLTAARAPSRSLLSVRSVARRHECGGATLPGIAFRPAGIPAKPLCRCLTLIGHDPRVGVTRGIFADAINRSS